MAYSISVTGANKKGGSNRYTYKGSTYNTLQEALAVKQQDDAKEEAKRKSDIAGIQAKKSQDMALKAIQATQQSSQPVSTPSTTAYSSGSSSGMVNYSSPTQSLSTSPSSAPQSTTVQTPYGTMTYQNGQWVYAESDEVKKQRQAYDQWQQSLMQQLQGNQDQETFRKAFIDKNLPEAERIYAQSMAGRGLLNSDAYSKGLGKISSDITTTAGLQSESERRNNIASLLSQLGSSQTGSNQYAAQPSTALSLGLSAVGQQNDQALNWANLGQNESQFQRSLAQRQTESAKDYGLQQANLLSSIFGSGGLF